MNITTATTVCTGLLITSSGTTSIFFEGVDKTSSRLIPATSRTTYTFTINALNTSLLLSLKVLLLQRLLRLLMLILLLLIIHELLLFIRLLLLLLIQLLLLLLTYFYNFFGCYYFFYNYDF